MIVLEAAGLRRRFPGNCPLGFNELREQGCVAPDTAGAAGRSQKDRCRRLLVTVR